MAISVDELKELIEEYEQYNNERLDDLIYHTDALNDMLRWYETKLIQASNE